MTTRTFRSRAKRPLRLALLLAFVSACTSHDARTGTGDDPAEAVVYPAHTLPSVPEPDLEWGAYDPKHDPWWREPLPVPCPTFEGETHRWLTRDPMTGAEVRDYRNNPDTPSSLRYEIQNCKSRDIPLDTPEMDALARRLEGTPWLPLERAEKLAPLPEVIPVCDIDGPTYAVRTVRSGAAMERHNPRWFPESRTLLIEHEGAGCPREVADAVMLVRVPEPLEHLELSSSFPEHLRAGGCGAARHDTYKRLGRERFEEKRDELFETAIERFTDAVVP